MNDELFESLLREADPAREITATHPCGIADAVRRRHLAVQRRRRFVRQGAGAAVMYAAGLATMWCWTAAPAESVSAQEPNPAVKSAAPLPERTPIAVVRGETDRRERAETPVDTPDVAPAASPYRTLRALGDRYLLQQGKVDLAADAYARALEHASDAERQVSYERDSWLLISLKRDRLVSTL